MRRFLFAFFFVATLSAVFSFSAFADSVVSSYQGSGSVVVEKKVTFPVSAAAGDQFYFDVSIVHQSDIIYDPSGRNISAQVYNKNLYWSWVVEPLGCNYAAASLSSEGSRIWVFFDRPISSGSITITYQITYTAYWRGGTFNGTPTVDLSTCSYQASFDVSNGSFTKNGSGWATDQTNSDKLDRILDALGEPTTSSPDFLGDDVVFYGRRDFFSRVFGASYNSDGWPVVTSFSDFGFYNWGSYNEPGYQFLPGTYILFIMRPGGIEPSEISFESVDSSSYSWNRISVSNQFNGDYYIDIIQLDIKSPLSYTTIHFKYSGAVSASVPVYIGVIPADSDYLAGSALNPEQDALSDDIDDAGHQQNQQESDMWQNINMYKSDLSFGLDGWDDAANGLSYVTNIFMTIWNNSPTQPIVLSLMLGIAMLSLGRGVMAAVRVQRNRRDE